MRTQKQSKSVTVVAFGFVDSVTVGRAWYADIATIAVRASTWRIVAWR